MEKEEELESSSWRLSQRWFVSGYARPYRQGGRNFGAMLGDLGPLLTAPKITSHEMDWIGSIQVTQIT